MADEQTAEQKQREAELTERQAKADAENKSRSGIGTRLKVGQTRGKGSMVISWEAFDRSQPETLPNSMKSFMEITKVTAEKDLLDLLIDGYNDAQYSAASDPIGDYVNPVWPPEVQTQFKLVVRNYARATGSSIEDAVALIKPGVEKAQARA